MLRLFIISSVILSGCATSTTGAIPAGRDTFVVSRQAGAFPSGREPLLAEALGEAGSTCASMGKVMKLISSTENPGPSFLAHAAPVYTLDNLDALAHALI